MSEKHLDCPEQVLFLPLPPSTNNLFVNIKGRGRIKAPKYRSWIWAAGWAIAKQNPLKFVGDVEVTILAARVNGRRRDIDNLIKPVLDLLVTHAVLKDDSQVRKVDATWMATSSDLTGLSVSIRPYHSPKEEGPA